MVMNMEEMERTLLIQVMSVLISNPSTLMKTKMQKKTKMKRVQWETLTKIREQIRAGGRFALRLQASMLRVTGKNMNPGIRGKLAGKRLHIKVVASAFVVSTSQRHLTMLHMTGSSVVRVAGAVTPVAPTATAICVSVAVAKQAPPMKQLYFLSSLLVVNMKTPARMTTHKKMLLVQPYLHFRLCRLEVWN